MARDIHPLLRPKEEADTPDEEAAPVEELEAPVAESEEAPESVEVPAEEEAPAEEEPDYLLKLDKRNFYQELSRLEQEDAEVRNILNTLVGRKASREYKPQLERLRMEMEELRATNRDLTLKSMTPQEIEEKFRTDADFAKEYAEAVHSQPAPRASSDLELQIRNEVEDVLDRAYGNLPPARVEQYREAIQRCPVHNTDDHGFFDHEPDGRGGLKWVDSPIRSLSLLKDGIAGESARVATQSAPAAVAAKSEAPAAPVAEKKKPTPNARLASAQPDLSPSGGASGSMTKMSVAEYQQLTPPERMKLFPSQEDYANARKSGLIYD